MFAVCSRKMQFVAGPNESTFHACVEHRPKLERGDVMLFFALDKDPVEVVSEDDEIECDFCREP